MKILIVDDNADDRRFLCYTILQHGHEPVEAVDGHDGLEKAALHRPDLIISDALMPRMDGFQFLQAVKKEKNLRNIPFIFFSAVYKGEQDRELALALGAAAFIAKPKTPGELCAELAPILEEKGLHPGAPTKAQAGPVPPIPENEFLREHSRVVAAKLEEKIRELELEIEGHRQTAAELRSSEERFRRLVESTTDYIYIVHVEDGRAVSTTHGPGCAAVTGYTTKEYGKDPDLWYRMIPEEDRPAVLEQAAMALKGEGAAAVEHRIAHKDGGIRWVRNTVVSNLGERGDVVAYDGLITDITERKEMEAKLIHAAREWAITFDSMADAVSVHDADFRILRVNTTLCTLLARPMNELLNRRCFEVFHRRTTPLPECPLEKTKRSRRKESIEIFEPTAGESGRWLAVTASPVIDDNGDVARIIHVARDITARKEAEAALERAHRRNELLLACAGEGIYGLDANGRVIFVNPAAARMLGYDAEDLIGKESHELWHHTKEDGTPYPASECPAHSALDNGHVSHQAEDVFWRADGTSFPVAYIATTIMEDDRPVGVVVVFNDITDRKEREEMLKSEMEMTSHLLMIAEASTHTSNLDRMMEEITHCVSRITGCDICLSYLWDRDAGVFRPSQAAGIDHEMVPMFKTGVLRRQGGLIMALDASMGPLVIDNPSLEGDDRSTLGWIGLIDSMAVIPLIGMQDYLGLIITVCRTEKKACGHGARGMKIMEGIMHQVSTALNQARLYRDSIEKSMLLSHKIETIQVMNELDKSILSTLDSREILETTTRMVARLIPCDRATIAIVNTKMGGFVRTAGFGTNVVPPGGLVPFAATSATEVIKTGSPQYEDNLGANDRRLPLEERLFREGFLSHIRIPLRVKGEIAGVLTTGARRASAYGPSDLATLEKLAYQIGVALNNSRLMTDLEELFMGTVKTLSSAIDAKSPWTSGHSARVTEYAVAIGREMGLPEKDLKDLELAGLLHDVGKIGTYESILDKPGRLTDEEISLMRRHPAKGADILSPIRQLGHIIPTVRHHHEFYGGSGYPDGIKGEEIPLFARIMTVADTVDAMSADRPYRKGRPLDVIVEELKRCTGTQFDPQVVEAFLVLAAREPDMLRGESSPLTPPQAP